MSIQEPIFATVTPFDEDGRISFSAIDENLSFLQENGVHRIVTNGTTAEFPSLTLDERKAVVDRCRKVFPGEIINNISACSVPDCLELLQHCTGLADAVLILPPFYYAEVLADGVAAFFRAVLRESKLPTYLYNFPRLTNVSISPDVLKELAGEFEHLKGVKDSSGDVEVSKRFKAVDPRLQVFMGRDALALRLLQEGLDGSITGGGNPLPECVHGINQAFRECEIGTAERKQGVFDIWNRHMKNPSTPEIPIVKAGMRARIPGFPVYCRPPFSEPPRDIVESARSVIEREVLPAL